jgi:hypothetical protein
LSLKQTNMRYGSVGQSASLSQSRSAVLRKNNKIIILKWDKVLCNVYKQQ